MDVSPAILIVAVSGRLAEKGKSGPLNVKARIFENPAQLQNSISAAYLASIPTDRFPILEKSMRLSDGTWFCLAQSMQFDSGNLAWLPLIQLVGITVIFALVMFFLVRFVTRPLSRLARAAKRFGENPGIAEILPENGADEVRTAIRSFGDMSNKLRDNLRERDFMLMAMAHDLKTPLARMRLRLEDVEKDELRKKLDSGCLDILHTVNHCLELGRSQRSGEPFAAIDLKAFAQSMADDYRDMGKNVVYIMESGQPMVIRTRPVCLERCVANLVDNALKYAGNAELVLRIRAGNMELAIEDAGPGVPPEEMENILRPWHRLEHSRNRATGGAGLGLAIAKNMAGLCNAGLELANRPEGGMSALLVFSPPE